MSQYSDVIFEIESKNDKISFVIAALLVSIIASFATPNIWLVPILQLLGMGILTYICWGKAFILHKNKKILTEPFGSCWKATYFNTIAGAISAIVTCIVLFGVGNNIFYFGALLGFVFMIFYDDAHKNERKIKAHYS